VAPDLGVVIWLTGLPCSGKSTLSEELARRFVARGRRVQVLDGDVIRRALWPELGFSREDRDANVRRAGFLAELFVEHGLVVIVALVSPYASARDAVRNRLQRFVEVFVDCPIDECVKRDVKGLYAAQRAGTVRGVTGVDDPYEAPARPDVHVRTDRADVASCADAVIARVLELGFLGEC
jgi:adenylyl-sulfate kinase